MCVPSLLLMMVLFTTFNIMAHERLGEKVLGRIFPDVLLSLFSPMKIWFVCCQGVKQLMRLVTLGDSEPLKLPLAPVYLWPPLLAVIGPGFYLLQGMFLIFIVGSWHKHQHLGAGRARFLVQIQDVTRKASHLSRCKLGSLSPCPVLKIFFFSTHGCLLTFLWDFNLLSHATNTSVR